MSQDVLLPYDLPPDALASLVAPGQNVTHLGNTLRVPVEVTTAVQTSAVLVTGPGQTVEVSVSCQQAFLSAFKEELAQRANITTSVVANVTCSNSKGGRLNSVRSSSIQAESLRRLMQLDPSVGASLNPTMTAMQEHQHRQQQANGLLLTWEGGRWQQRRELQQDSPGGTAVGGGCGGGNSTLSLVVVLAVPPDSPFTAAQYKVRCRGRCTPNAVLSASPAAVLPPRPTDRIKARAALSAMRPLEQVTSSLIGYYARIAPAGPCASDLGGMDRPVPVGRGAGPLSPAPVRPHHGRNRNPHGGACTACNYRR